MHRATAPTPKIKVHEFDDVYFVVVDVIYFECLEHTIIISNNFFLLHASYDNTFAFHFTLALIVCLTCVYFDEVHAVTRLVF